VFFVTVTYISNARQILYPRLQPFMLDSITGRDKTGSFLQNIQTSAHPASSAVGTGGYLWREVSAEVRNG
jgi:hypothetical protein